MNRRLFVVLLGALLGGCEDSAPDPLPQDRLRPSRATLFPAFSPDMPQVVSSGGPIMTTPRAVAVTFQGDPLADDLEKFVDAIGASSYWTATTAEYGIGPIRALTPIRLSETAPNLITDGEIQAWLNARITDRALLFPPAELDTVYVLFYPSTTTIVFESVSHSTRRPASTETRSRSRSACTIRRIRGMEPPLSRSGRGSAM